jgi:hypothetical protein
LKIEDMTFKDWKLNEADHCSFHVRVSRGYVAAAPLTLEVLA